MAHRLERFLAGIRSGAWLTRERLFGYAGILLGYEVLAAIYIAIAVAPGMPTGSDFSSFYTAGQLASAGTPQLAYDQAAHHAAQLQLYGRQVPYNYFYYPPVWLMVCAGLAHLPYLASMFLFEAATLAAALAAAWRVLQAQDRRMIVVLLAFPPLFWNVAVEQNAFLSAAILGGATLLIDRRPVLAGALIGVLAYKPHFGLLIPVALAASANWRAFAAAAASVCALALLTSLTFGWEIWAAYLHAALGSGAAYASGIDISGIATPYGAILALGGKPACAFGAEALTAILAAYWVARAWHGGARLETRAAILIAAIPLAAPILLFYDLVLSGIAMLWLVRRAAQAGFFAYEKSALAAIYLATILTGHMNGTPRFLVAPAIAIALFVLAARRVQSETAQGPAIAPEARRVYS
jgi:hypothetical protein